MGLEVKKHRDNYEVNVSNGNRNSNKSSYHNIIDRDPNKIAQVLIDLYLAGFPMLKAIALMKSRLSRKDWLGF